MKRFYTSVNVTKADRGQFAVKLDGRPVRTPGGNRLVLPTRRLADRVAAEWEAQHEDINPSSMPLTGLSNAAIDRLGPARESATETLTRHIDSDPVRMRATEPDALVEAEGRIWNPLIDRFRARFGLSLGLSCTMALPDPQPEAGLCIRHHARRLNDFRFTALVNTVQNLGSVVVAIALMEDDIDMDTAFEAAFLEELHQAGRWGIDREAESRRRVIRRDTEHALELDRLVRIA